MENKKKVNFEGRMKQIDVCRDTRTLGRQAGEADTRKATLRAQKGTNMVGRSEGKNKYYRH